MISIRAAETPPEALLMVAEWLEDEPGCVVAVRKLRIRANRILRKQELQHAL
jgi:hypothetical protein